MVPIWKTICWIIMGFIIGYITGDPDKRKYFD